MTDDWDKLWNRHITTVTETEEISDKEVIQIYVGDLRKVKAEGDRLKEKALCYDKVWDENGETIVDLIVCSKKLETIRKLCSEIPSVHYRPTIGKIMAVLDE